MINDVLNKIENEIIRKIKSEKNLNLWCCYFSLSENCIKPININLSELNLNQHGNIIISIKSNELYINIQKLKTDKIYFSENEDNCIDFYNYEIFKYIADLNDKINEMHEKIIEYKNKIQLAEEFFQDSDIILETLCRKEGVK